MQLATLLIGLMAATALWSGVQAINAQARSSYDRAAARLRRRQHAMLVPTQDVTVPQSLFAQLRRAGWLVSPVIEGSVRIRGRQVRLIGVEPISLPRGAGPAPDIAQQALESFLAPGGQTLIAAETARELGGSEGGRLATDAGEALPPLHVAADLIAEFAGDGHRLGAAHLAQAGSRFAVSARRQCRQRAGAAAGGCRRELATGRGRRRDRSAAFDRKLSSQSHRVRPAVVPRRALHRAFGDRAWRSSSGCRCCAPCAPAASLRARWSRCWSPSWCCSPCSPALAASSAAISSPRCCCPTSRRACAGSMAPASRASLRSRRNGGLPHLR